MPFTIDAVDPTSGGGFSLIPDGDYDLVITKTEEKTSAKGNPLVNVTFEIINNEEFNGRKLFHNITFLKDGEKGAGISRHFLKCIGQPFGAVEVNPEAWIGKNIKAKVGARSYTNSKGKDVTINDIKEVEADDIPF